MIGGVKQWQRAEPSLVKSNKEMSNNFPLSRINHTLVYPRRIVRFPLTYSQNLAISRDKSYTIEFPDHPGVSYPLTVALLDLIKLINQDVTRFS